MSWGLIREMGHVAIQTTDVDAAVADATQLLGLRVTERTGNDVNLAAGNVHHELVYVDSNVNGIHSLGLIARDGEALRTIRKRVEAENLHIVSDKAYSAGVQDGFSFIGPEGWIFEIYVGMQENISREPTFGPNRYGHINFHPQDVVGMKNFLERVLDFRLSDVIGDDFAYFMRCNPDHHGIALIAGRGTFHHHAWEAQSIADLGKLGDRLHLAGRELIWGPVRHGAGHNIAAYYVEASGAVVELYTDLEQIYDDARPPIKWGADDNWWNMWSSFRPDSFRTFGIPPVTNRR
ncbi:VOC family protein [Arthrobacter sp. AZCC_0090]|uniref:VOC family protein n=1 Tax=Arthrobacter sp. AZCC_0090 TaxID=2735881 RepID=UPI00160FD5CF|nr:VOC family protein [Arthrobacter sp. AZCC_0090]MBB6407187.1 catechol 2,3-dioxygenase-like lactoylglutathione lyase family enzyme [Arthrobacter sp. AZCC_0090]